MICLLFVWFLHFLFFLEFCAFWVNFVQIFQSFFVPFLVSWFIFFCLSGAWAWDFELGACGWELKFQEFLSMPCSCLACLAGLAWFAWWGNWTSQGLNIQIWPYKQNLKMQKPESCYKLHTRICRNFCKCAGQVHFLQTKWVPKVMLYHYCFLIIKNKKGGVGGGVIFMGTHLQNLASIANPIENSGSKPENGTLENTM